MSGTIKDYAEALLVVRQILEKRIQDNPDDPEFAIALEEYEDAFVRSWGRGIEMINIFVEEKKQAAPAAFLPAVVAPPEPAVESGTEWYGRFATLFAKYEIPTPDGIRRWFADVGGWDLATEGTKADVYGKAVAYYLSKHDPNGEKDITKCYACGTPGTNRGKFYSCPNPKCGFMGREGKWVNSTWDIDGGNWQEKRDRLRSAGRGRR